MRRRWRHVQLKFRADDVHQWRTPRRVRGGLRTTLAVWCALVLASLPLTSSSALAVDIPVPYADPMFLRIWDQADATVASGETVRSWLWGPQPIGMSRDYYVQSTAPEHLRLVQYFDKARMEITDPGADTGSPWYVTNGLLVKELVSGERQYGDAEFVPGSPAPIPVAGDLGDSSNLQFKHFEPYATLDGVSNQAPDRTGEIVDVSLFPNQPPGNAAGYPAVTYAAYEPTLRHNIASVFWYWMHTPENGILTYGSWVYPMGYPISEPYWTTVTVGGTPTPVLVQLFERRVLTYTPSNPAAWRVEMGNVGAAYMQWFDGDGVQRAMYAPDDPHALVISASINGSADVFRLQDDGSGLTAIAASAYDEDLAQVLPGGEVVYRQYDGGSATSYRGMDDDSASALPWVAPLFDPAGERVAYRCVGICVVDPDVGLVVVLENSANGTSVITGDWRWSPDGRYLAYRSRANAAHTAATLYIADTFTGNAWQVGADDLYTGSDVVVSPRSWSLDNDTLLFTISGEIDGEWSESVHLVHLADVTTTTLVPFRGSIDGAFSPVDPTLMVLTRVADNGDVGLWTVRTDDSDLTQLTDGPQHSAPAWNSDGTRLVFRDDSAPDGAFRVINADGSNEHEVFRP